MRPFEQFTLFDNSATMTTFYNTTGFMGAELKSRRIKAGGETERILSFFEAHPNDMFAPFEVESRLFPNAHSRHFTNTRRSLTTLTKMGKLEKTEIKVTDPETYEMCHCWRLKTK